MLRSLFKAYPEYQKMFKQLADIPLDKLATAPKMRAHGSVVMNNVDAMIDALPEQECIEEIIRKIVVTHAPRKVTPGHFEVTVDRYWIFIDWLLVKKILHAINSIGLLL